MVDISGEMLQEFLENRRDSNNVGTCPLHTGNIAYAGGLYTAYFLLINIH